MVSLAILSCSPIDPLPAPIDAEFAEENDGSIRFISSSSDDYQTAFWTILGAAYQNPFDSVTVSVQKLSGHDEGDFGIIFCYQDDDNFYLVSIDIEGNYAAKKRTNGSFSTLIDWTESDNLETVDSRIKFPGTPALNFAEKALQFLEFSHNLVAKTSPGVSTRAGVKQTGWYTDQCLCICVSNSVIMLSNSRTEKHFFVRAISHA
jgi:hypothetical protein